MKNALFAALAIVALSAASAALTALALTRPPAPTEIDREAVLREPREPGPARSVDLDALRAIEDRQSEIARDQRRIFERLDALATRLDGIESASAAAGDEAKARRAFAPEAGNGDGDGDARRDPAATTSEALVLAGLSRGEGEPSPALEKAVARALEDIRETEKLDRIESYHAERSERLERDVERIGEWLELDAPQRDEMQRVLEARYAGEAEILRLQREGVDPEVLEQRRRDGAERFRRDAERFLYPDQFTEFWTKFQPRNGK